MVFTLLILGTFLYALGLIVMLTLDDLTTSVATLATSVDKAVAKMEAQKVDPAKVDAVAQAVNSAVAKLDAASN
jgi:hypothetical protein